ncbi:hypothetical protein NDU88_002260 [Pleurodeles waltl]|uniref:Uncharacterized protein n=1 Tax=Pleurodeles waltl TaxID=8319 RepID=A0AAV7RFA6_PLEWA|nr:hypothetical protein NDU88_002260 [Pleurodeles waltl]
MHGGAHRRRGEWRKSDAGVHASPNSEVQSREFITENSVRMLEEMLTQNGNRMDSTDYGQECMRFLGDATYYAPITMDPSERLQTQIRSLIEEARTNMWISRKEAEFLETTHPRIP